MRPFHSSMAGMVAEAGGDPHSLVVASPKGLMKLCDARMVGAAQLGVWKTVEAHTKGHVTALTAHPHAPLLATGTSMQVCAHAPNYV